MRPLRVVASVTVVLAVAATAVFVACSSGSTDSLSGGPRGDGDSSVTDGSSLANEDAPLGLIADVGVDTGPPLNSVDAADIPEGGAKVTPGVIACASVGTCNAFAGIQCCPGDDDGGGACVAASLTCAPGGSLRCEESADCIVGTVCCGSVTPVDDAGGGPYLSTACAASCAALHAPPIQLCRTNGECGDAGPCVIETCSDGNTYELCGGSTGLLPDGGGTLDDGGDDGGAGFTCTPQ